MTMSNDELQKAIAHALQDVEHAPQPLKVDLIVHAKALLNEQRRRAELVRAQEPERLYPADKWG